MDLTKHTPGPWSFRPTGTWPNTNHHLGIYADRMPEIAKVEGYGSVSTANARLIAAAPDLLDAIIECRKQIDKIIEDGVPTDWRMWRDDLDALIAKATIPA